MDADASEPARADVAAGEPLRALAPSIRAVWRIKMVGLSTLLFLPALFYDLTHLFSPNAQLPFGVVSGTVLVGAALYCLMWPRLRYRAWGFALRPEEIYMEHGVLRHIRTVVPLRRIQHVDVSQDLVEREFALGRLVVHTAGSRSSDVVIPGLPLPEAEDIRDKIKRFILEDPLVEEPV
jgi:membrane protein YdbS with pleckstrin-like domain